MSTLASRTLLPSSWAAFRNRRPKNPPRRQVMKQVRSLVVLATLCCIGLPVLAQQKPPEEPGWAKGRPKSDTAMAMAPVPAFPIPTAPDKLPTSKFKLPPGFKVETWASGVLDARGLREGAKGNIFVSSLFVANKVYVCLLYTSDAADERSSVD